MVNFSRSVPQRDCWQMRSLSAHPTRLCQRTKLDLKRDRTRLLTPSDAIADAIADGGSTEHPSI